MDKKQQQLAFDKGITNLPSDPICSDNTLTESIGIVYNDGEHHVIQKPKLEIANMNGRLMCIHKIESTINYIFLSGKTLKWRNNYNSGTVLELDSTANLQVVSIGKTLVIKAAGGLKYSLWKEDDNNVFYYKSLADLPVLDVEFHLVGRYSNVSSSKKYEGIFERRSQGNYGFELAPKTGQLDAYKDFFVGLYAENKEKIRKECGFCLPFFACAAIEMYDGTFTRITNPVLLQPCVTNNTIGYFVRDHEEYFALRTYYTTLKHSLKTNLSDYSDIVKEVCVFITDGVDIFDTEKPASPLLAVREDVEETEDNDARRCFVDGIFLDASYNSTDTVSDFHKREIKYRNDDGTETGHIEVYGIEDGEVFDRRDLAFVADSMITQPFYKLCKVGGEFEHTVLDFLNTQQQLNTSGYFSNNTLQAENILTYNNRLLLAGIKRNFFEGFHLFKPQYNQNEEGARYAFFVTIETQAGKKIVRHVVEDWKYMIGGYFFYPDTRAKKVDIYKNGVKIYSLNLKEHPVLHGAVYFDKNSLYAISSYSDDPVNVETQETEPSYTPPAAEELQNTLVLSEVNNPFTFNASGYFNAGTGKVLGVSTQTVALSQGQFGQYPLIIFTDEGIWAASIASTGYVSAVHPMSREVCNNPATITQTDGAVFFSSEKGLMVVVGSAVKCVSEQLAGKHAVEGLPFHVFLRDAHIAYDYRDSLLWIGREDSDIIWIYSIKSGTFAHYQLTPSTIRHLQKVWRQKALVPGRASAMELTFDGIVDNAGQAKLAAYIALNDGMLSPINGSFSRTVTYNRQWKSNNRLLFHRDTNRFFLHVDASSEYGEEYSDIYIRIWGEFFYDYLPLDYMVYQGGDQYVPRTDVIFTDKTENKQYQWDGTQLYEIETEENTGSETGGEGGSESGGSESGNEGGNEGSGSQGTTDTSSDTVAMNFVNNYPDTLMQIGTKVYSLLHRANINDDESTYNAVMITRPMKLENALALKSILQVKHIKDFATASVPAGSSSGLTLTILASNNLKSWVEVKSLGGTPWKYYRFQYNFTNLHAVDTFAGTLLITQERRTGKLR